MKLRAGCVIAGCIVFLIVGELRAQSSGGFEMPAVSSQPVDYLSAQQIAMKAKDLTTQAAAAAGGIAGVTLEKYNGHLTMLTVRVKSGVGEFHKRDNDIFIVLDGDATVLTGGMLVDPKAAASPDEIVGTRVEGGVAHVLHKGDTLHIPANTPHQTMVAPGKTFTYYVIKIAEPKQ